MLDQRGARHLQAFREPIGASQQRFFDRHGDRFGAAPSPRPTRFFLDSLPLASAIFVKDAEGISDEFSIQVRRGLLEIIDS